VHAIACGPSLGGKKGRWENFSIEQIHGFELEIETFPRQMRNLPQ